MQKTLAVLFAALLLTAITPAFAWETERPSADYPINIRAKDMAGTDSEASVGLGVHVERYLENSYQGAFGYKDAVVLNIAGTANTRKGITYTQSVSTGLFDWVQAVTSTGIVDDNSGAWFALPFPVRFYGGPGYPYISAEYDKVWVSSNGFLSFDSSSNSSSPQQIPNSSGPNSLLAVYWSNLDPSGGSVKYYSDMNIFVILWDNVLNRNNGIRQTFEVIIHNSQMPTSRGQNKIRLLYKSVTWSDDAVAGIEDQEGYKGTIPGEVPQSGQSLLLTAVREAAYINRIRINLQKSDDQALLLINQNYWYLMGHNVKLHGSLERGSGIMEQAIKGYGSLLVTSVMKRIVETTIGHSISFIGGLMIGGIMVTLPLALDYVRSLSPLNIPAATIEDAYENESLAFVDAYADSISSDGFPVDASVAMQVLWLFDDPNSVDHSLTISAELEYYSYVTNTVVQLPLAAPVTLRFLRESEPKGVSFPADIWGSLGIDDREDSFFYMMHTPWGDVFNNKVVVDPDGDMDVNLTLYNYGEHPNVIGYSDFGGPGGIETIVEGPFLQTSYVLRLVKVTYKSSSTPGEKYHLQIIKEPASAPPPGGEGGGGEPPEDMMW